MENRKFMECTGLVNCICVKCDLSGEKAFAQAENTAGRIAILADKVQTRLMQLLSKSGPNAKFEKKLVEAYSEEVKKTAKRMKKDLDLRKKYVFDEQDFEHQPETAAPDVEPKPPTPPPTGGEPEAQAVATSTPFKTSNEQAEEEGDAPSADSPDEDSKEAELEAIAAEEERLKQEEEDKMEEAKPRQSMMSEIWPPRASVGGDSSAVPTAVQLIQMKKASTAFTDVPDASGGAASPSKKKAGLFFLLPKKIGKFKFTQRGREILWMRNVRPVILKGDKIAYPKLEVVTMVICNDVMFLAVHQKQITESQTYVLVHFPVLRDEARAEELNPELGEIYFRLLLGKQEFIVQASSKQEVSYWVRTINQRRGFKTTASLINTFG